MPERLCRFAHQIGVLDRDRAQNHAGQTFVDPGLDGGHVADAATQLRGHVAGFQNRLDRGGVDRLTCKSAVQIDQMQPLAPGLDKGAGLRGGVFVEHGGLVHFTTQQAHGIAVFEVDGGVEDHVGRPYICVARAGYRTGGAGDATRRWVILARSWLPGQTAIKTGRPS